MTDIFGTVISYNPGTGEGTVRATNGVEMGFVLHPPVQFQLTGMTCIVQGDLIGGQICNAVITPMHTYGRHALALLLRAGVPTPGPHGSTIYLLAPPELANAMADAVHSCTDDTDGVLDRWAVAPVKAFTYLFDRLDDDLKTEQNRQVVHNAAHAVEDALIGIDFISFVSVYTHAWSMAVQDAVPDLDDPDPYNAASETYSKIRYYYDDENSFPFRMLVGDPWIIARIQNPPYPWRSLIKIADHIAMILWPGIPQNEMLWRRAQGVALAAGFRKIAGGDDSVHFGYLINVTNRILNINETTDEDIVQLAVRGLNGIHIVKRDRMNWFRDDNNNTCMSPSFVFFPEGEAASAIAHRLIVGNTTQRHVDVHALASQMPHLHGLTEEQLNAIDGMLNSLICVLTGGPGRGKTRTLAAAAITAYSLGENVLLLASTGRAARVLQDACANLGLQIPVYTVHSAIGRGGGNEIQELKEATWVGVDEASMLTIDVAGSLLGKLPPSCTVVFAGDPNQLQAVGPGRILQDLISLQHEGVRVCTLLQNHRQVGSGGYIIAQAADGILHGIAPAAVPPSLDVIDVTGLTEAGVADMVMDFISSLGAPQLPPESFFVITPWKSTRELLSRRIRQLYLPASGDQGFTPGDRVMQIVNVYDNGHFIANGELGTVQDVYVNDAGVLEWVQVVFDSGLVSRCHMLPVRSTWGTSPGEAQGVHVHQPIYNIQLAWAATVHKAQGGEAEHVILVIPRKRGDEGEEEQVEASKGFLNRNLLYTAITRASARCTIFTDPGLLEEIVQTEPNTRRSLLPSRILRRLPPPPLQDGFTVPGSGLSV